MPWAEDGRLKCRTFPCQETLYQVLHLLEFSHEIDDDDDDDGDDDDDVNSNIAQGAIGASIFNFKGTAPLQGENVI